jgi:uncharacterized protein YndB with AHSA1/START domain
MRYQHATKDRDQAMNEPQAPGVSAEPKAISVPVPLEAAFRAYVELAMEWLPPAHRFSAGTASMTIEPRVGGRFYESAEDGTEAVRGTVLEWCPSDRLVMTWRVGPGWRPLPDDEHAPHIEVNFTARGASSEVKVSYTNLEACEPSFASELAAVLAVPGPGETLERYAEVAARHAASYHGGQRG